MKLQLMLCLDASMRCADYPVSSSKKLITKTPIIPNYKLNDQVHCVSFILRIKMIKFILQGEKNEN